MAIYTEEIYAEAVKVMGESETLKAFCAIAEDSLRRNLREDVAEDECKTTLILAAAMLAESMLAVAETDGTEYSAGTVSVKSGGTLAAAAILRAQAEEIMAPYSRGKGFAFLGVRGW